MILFIKLLTIVVFLQHNFSIIVDGRSNGELCVNGIKLVSNSLSARGARTAEKFVTLCCIYGASHCRVQTALSALSLQTLRCECATSIVSVAACVDT